MLADDGLPRLVWADAEVDPRRYAGVMLAAVAQRRAWRAQYEHAQQVSGTEPPRPGPVHNRSATAPAATDVA